MGLVSGSIYMWYIGSIYLYVCLWVHTNLCVSMGAYGELWVWDLSTHEVPGDTYKYPLGWLKKTRF